MRKKFKKSKNSGKTKITIQKYIARVQEGEDIQVLCCLSNYRKLQKYNNQSYIAEDGKQKFLNLNGLLHLEKIHKSNLHSLTFLKNENIYRLGILV